MMSIRDDEHTHAQGILKAAQAISGVSVMRHVAGQQEAVVREDHFVITTRRVSTINFEGLVFTDASAIVTVDLPPNFFTLAILKGQKEVDVMLVVWDIATPPLPSPTGSAGNIREDFVSPIVTLEVRLPGSTEKVEWMEKLETPVLLSIINSRSVDSTEDFATGRALMPAPMLWDWSEWAWKIETGTRSIREVSGSTGRVVTAATDVLEHLAIVVLLAGCREDDGARHPKSPTVLDACRVCNGDNSTCSGCDGKPNTGSSRACNGHGKCGLDRCSCTAFYFGVECETYCSELSTCSGHGQCNPASGVPCDCQPGWQTHQARAAAAAAKDDTAAAAGMNVSRGPYCSEPGYDPFGKPDSDRKPPVWQLVLIIVLPSLVVCTCIVYTVREVQRENGFNDNANRMMIRVGLEKKDAPEAVDTEVPVPDILPPSDPAHAEMIDMAPYHANRCVELQPLKRCEILALSDQVLSLPFSEAASPLTAC
jgi:hypothetical protein